MQKPHKHTKYNWFLLLVLPLFISLLHCQGPQTEKPKPSTQPPAALPSEPPSAQTKTDSSIQLIPVDVGEVFPFYITQDIRGDSIVLYEGGKLTYLKLQEGEMAGISKNERYFTIYKEVRVTGKKFNYSRYEVEVRTIKNKVICKGTIDAVGSFEGPDAIYPFDDGKRICIYGRATELPGFAIYRMSPSGDGFTEDFRFLEYDDVQHVGGFTLSEAQERVVTTYEDYRGDTLLVRCYNLKGDLLWKKMMRDCNGYGEISISDYDGSIVFPKVPKRQKPTDKVPIYQTVLNPKGKIIHEFEVKYTSGPDHPYFSLINGQQYFVHSDGGRNIHIYDFERDSVITRIYRDDSPAKMYRKQNVLFDGRQLISGDYTVTQSLTDPTLISSDKKIVVEDIETGETKETPVNMKYLPYLVKRGNNLYVVNLTDQWELSKNELCYKIQIKK